MYSVNTTPEICIIITALKEYDLVVLPYPPSEVDYTLKLLRTLIPDVSLVVLYLAALGLLIA